MKSLIYLLIYPLIYRIVGVVFFTLGMIYMPGEWYVKLMLWAGIGMLVNTGAFKKGGERK